MTRDRTTVNPNLKEQHADTAPADRLGILEWFRPGEEARVKAVLADLKALGVKELRTGFSWADYYSKPGKAWYDWLIPTLSEQVNVLPCFTYTPPTIGIEPKSSAPPKNPKAFADFLDVVLGDLGQHFEYVELWNEPNNISDWDYRLDPHWLIYCEMITMAANWARELGFKTVLGGMSPTDPVWLDMVCSRGLFEYIDVLGIHGFPETWDLDWVSWHHEIKKVTRVLDKYDLDTKLWLTETGYSTWNHDEFAQVQRFAAAMGAKDIERVYWYGLYDLHPDLPHLEGFHLDERHYHCGLVKANGAKKMLYRLIESRGAEGAIVFAKWGGAGRDTSSLRDRGPMPAKRKRTRDKTVVFGGAGFIGSHLADQLLKEEREVLIFDNLGSQTMDDNIQWLRSRHKEGLEVKVADIRNSFEVRDAIAQAETVYHLAGQTSEAASIREPVEDFAINAQGTLNILEALARFDDPPFLVFASSAKIYGTLEDVELRSDDLRYVPIHFEDVSVDEQRPIAPRSPYACSKATADQYTLEYARSGKIRATSLRLGSTYGPGQSPKFRENWIAQLCWLALLDLPLHILGTGYQVRDLLFVDDAVTALSSACQRQNRTHAKAFNVGGGRDNAASLLRIKRLLEQLLETKLDTETAELPEHHQRYYVSNFSAFSEATGWQPRVRMENGIARLCKWLQLEKIEPTEESLATRGVY